MYGSKMKSEETDHLFEAILSLKALEECYRFFDDLCTFSELQAKTQRLQVAEMLEAATPSPRSPRRSACPPPPSRASTSASATARTATRSSSSA